MVARTQVFQRTINGPSVIGNGTIFLTTIYFVWISKFLTWTTEIFDFKTEISFEKFNFEIQKRPDQSFNFVCPEDNRILYFFTFPIVLACMLACCCSALSIMKCIIRCRHDEQIIAERDFRLAQRNYSSKSERERWIRLVSK